MNGFVDNATPQRDPGFAPLGLNEGDGAPQAGTDADGGQEREKRSRDRYGRDRGPRGDRAERGERSERQDRAPLDGQQPLEGFAADSRGSNALPAPVDREPRASYFAVSAAAPVAPFAAAAPTTAPTRANSAETAVTNAPMVMPVAAPAPTSAPAEAKVPTPAVAPRQSAPAPAATATAQGLPKVQTFELPVDSLNQVAQTAGLAWVNSDPQKAASVKAAIAAEPKPIHVPRERLASVQVDTSPLVLVETKRDLRNMTLPFEQNRPQ